MIYCCITNYHKLYGAQQHSFVILQILWVRRLGQLGWASHFRVSHKAFIQEAASQGWSLICSLTGEGSVSWLTWLCTVPGGLLDWGPWLLAAHWPEATLSSLPYGPLYMAAYSIRASEAGSQYRESASRASVIGLCSVIMGWSGIPPFVVFHWSETSHSPTCS